jgi:hypothetical protein
MLMMEVAPLWKVEPPKPRPKGLGNEARKKACQARYLAFMQHGPVTASDFAREFQLAKPRGALRDLERDGLIKRIGVIGKKKAILWELV